MHSKHEKSGLSPPRPATDSEMLDETVRKIYEELMSTKLNPKLADFFRALEIKHKLKLTDDGKEKALEIIDRLREQGLGAVSDDH